MELLWITDDLNFSTGIVDSADLNIIRDLENNGLDYEN